MTNEVANMILTYVPSDELINSAITTVSNAADGTAMFAGITGIVCVVCAIIGIFAIKSEVVGNWFSNHDFTMLVVIALFVFSLIGNIVGVGMHWNYNADLEKLQSGVEPVQIVTALEYYDID